MLLKLYLSCSICHEAVNIYVILAIKNAFAKIRNDSAHSVHYVWISFSLVLLVFLNVALFLKLSMIEHAAQSLYHVQLQEEVSTT